LPGLSSSRCRERGYHGDRHAQRPLGAPACQPLHARVHGSGAPVLPPLVQRGAANDVFIAARKQGDADYYPMMAGQSVGLVRDLPGAGEVVAAVIREARAVLSALPDRVRQA